MTRISLVEAYDDKDVITQIAKMKDKLDSIPDDADLSNCVLKVNNQIIDGRKTFNDVIVANDGIAVTGDLNVDGNIVQSGAAVEVHVEEIYTKNDYIVMREDAATAIPPGQFSGLLITKYNGLDNGRMVMDQSGTMRVGDVGQEEPLATREEAANMTSGALVKWDGVNNRMIAPASNIGDETHPVKIVAGEPVALTDPLVVNKVYTKTATTSVPSGTTTALASTVTVLEAGTYLFVGQGELSTNPSTTQTYTVHMIVNGGATNLFMGNFSVDSYARYTVSSVVTVAANSTIGLGINQNLGTAVSCPSTVFAVRLV